MEGRFHERRLVVSLKLVRSPVLRTRAPPPLRPEPPQPGLLFYLILVNSSYRATHRHQPSTPPTPIPYLSDAPASSLYLSARLHRPSLTRHVPCFPHHRQRSTTSTPTTATARRRSKKVVPLVYVSLWLSRIACRRARRIVKTR